MIRPGVMRVSIARIKSFLVNIMRIPGINILILKKNSFDRAIRESAEKARAEQRQMTNALISKLLRENARLRAK